MATDRQRFGAEELVICLSHFDLGIIHGVEDIPRGSRRSPKAIIEAERGKFLFKRRAKGRDDMTKVAFTHQIQIYLAGQNFPLPHLIGTRKENNSMLVREGAIYELFEFVDGGPYDRSLDATFHAGRILGLYHKLLTGFSSEYTPPTGSYHNAEAIQQAIQNTVGSLPLDSRPPKEVLTGVVQSLRRSYADSAKGAEELGINEWAPQIVHGDWHPGNMMFREGRVVAVIDYDSARMHQRVIDLANGALQFSILGGSEDPSQWPDYVDMSRFKRFMRGYDSVNVISRRELQAVPLLMCEAAIAEAVWPIAATGSFGRIEGFPFLQMIDRKVGWILKHQDDLTNVLEES